MRPAADARRRRVVTAVCAGLLVLPLLVVVGAGGLRLDRAGEAARMAWAFAKPDPAGAFTDRASFVGVVRLSALLEWLLPAAVAVVVVVLRLRGRLSATAFAAVAVVVVALDLFRAGVGYNPAIPRSHATQPATGAIRFLQSRRPERFVGLDPAIPLAVPVLPDVATRYGLLDARGYDFPVERRYAELWRGAIAREPACNYAFCVGSVGIRPAAFRALGLFGVTHLVQTPTDAPVPGLRVAYAGRDARIYENPYALPRAFLVGHQTVVAGADAARAAVTAPGFRGRDDRRDRAAAARPAQRRRRRRRPRRGRPPSRATSPSASSSGRGATRPSLLVLGDSFFPGWTATVDGRDAPIHRVDDLFRGVQLPAGAHTVEFRYRPATFKIGAVVSLLTLLALVATAVVGLRAGRARRSRPGRAAPAG